MLIYQIVFSVIAVIYLMTVLILLFKSKGLIKELLLSSGLGVSLLIVLKAVESFIGLKLYINIITVLASLILGPCGVLLCLLIDYFII